MLRLILWSLLAIFLLVVGAWPAAAAPVALAATGAVALIAAIPAPVLAAVALIAWLKHNPTPAKPRSA